MIRTVKAFLSAEVVISIYKNNLEILHLSGKPPAVPRQRWDIVTQISIVPLLR